MKLVKVKSIKYHSRQKALNISMKKNHNFMLKNGILTHNTKDAQNALRNIMETYASNVFFILTCNNINKIIDPLQSRCVVREFKKPDKKEINTYLADICKKESITFKEDAMTQLININYPSIRNCVNTLQDLKTNKKDLTLTNLETIDDDYMKVWNFIKERKFNNAVSFIIEEGIDCELTNRWIFYHILKNEEKLETKELVRLIRVVGNNADSFSRNADPQMTFITSLTYMMGI